MPQQTTLLSPAHPTFSSEGAERFVRPQSPVEQLNASPDYLRDLCQQAVGGSDVYQELTANPRFDQNQAYVRAAKALVADRDAPLDPFERDILSLSAHMGDFIKAGTALDAFRDGGYLSDTDRSAMTRIKLEEIIPFNHALKELISRFPRLSAEALALNLTVANRDIYEHRKPRDPARALHEFHAHPDDTTYEFTATVNGMRHERAAESLLTAADIDYDYRVSAEEDSRGNDLFVYLNGRWIGIDIKGSYGAEARAHLRHRDSLAVWTTLDADDFRGPDDTLENAVSISSETAHDHALAFRDRIYEAMSGSLNEQHRHRQHRAQKRGRHALRAAGHRSR